MMAAAGSPTASTITASEHAITGVVRAMMSSAVAYQVAEFTR
jgi:hypothetical protein